MRCQAGNHRFQWLLVGILGIPAVLVLFGWDYSGSILSFLFLLPGVGVLGGASILASDLATREKPKYSLWINCIILVANIVLNFAFIPVMGIAGAAVASSISYISALALWLAFYRYESGASIQEMIPRFEDVKYLFVVFISIIRTVIVSSKSRLKSIGLTDTRK